MLSFFLCVSHVPCFNSNHVTSVPSDAEILKLVGRMGAARFTANRQRATSTETLELEPIYPEATPDHIRRRAITDPAEFCYDSDFEQLKDRVVQLKERETTYAEMVLKLKVSLVDVVVVTMFRPWIGYTHDHRTQVLANNFEQAIQHLSDIYMESWQEFSGLEKLLNDLIEEYRLVQAKIEALQTMSSKLQYDVDALDEKMRETDEIVDHFFHKIKAVEEQMATLQNLNGPRVIAPATVDARR